MSHGLVGYGVRLLFLVIGSSRVRVSLGQFVVMLLFVYGSAWLSPQLSIPPPTKSIFVNREGGNMSILEAVPHFACAGR